jgi:hypothetical protein
MSGLNNKQVENFGKLMLGNNFLGVYPCDSTPRIKKLDNKSVIFNLSKHNEPGSHYVAVIFNNDKIFYFDSYGKPLKNKHIKKTLMKFKIPIFYHIRPIQSNDSIFCGFFVLAYLKALRTLKLQPYEFYKLFNNPPNKQNDDIVIQLLLSNKKNKKYVLFFYLNEFIFYSTSQVSTV